MTTLSAFLSAGCCIQAALVLFGPGVAPSPTEAPKERAILRGHRRHISSVAFSPNGKILASASRDNTVQLWEVATGRRIRQLEDDGDPRGAVEAVLFSPDGKSLAAARWGGTVILWEVATWRIRARIEKQPIYLKTQMAFSPDSKTLAFGGWPGISFWDFARNAEPRKAETQTPTLGVALAYTPQGKPLFARLTPESLQLWDGASGNQGTTLKKPWYTSGRLAISADAKLLAAQARAQMVKLFDLTTNKEVAAYSLVPGAPPSIRCLTFSPDGKVLALAHADSGKGNITLIDLATGKPFASWVAYTDRSMGDMDLTFSPDGRILASYRCVGMDGVDYTVKLWDVPPVSTSSK